MENQEEWGKYEKMVKNIEKSISKTRTIAPEGKKTLWVIVILTSILFVGLVYGLTYGEYITSWDTAASGNERPLGITIYGENNYIIDEVDDEIYKYGESGTYISKCSVNASNTGGIGIWTNGTETLVLDTQDKAVYIYDMLCNDIGFWYLNATNTDPRGITSNKTDVVISDFGQKKAYRYSRTGTYRDVFETINSSSDVGGRNSVATFGNFLYFIDGDYDTITNKIYKQGYDGSFVNEFTANAGNTYSFGLATNGEYFRVTDQDDGEVYVYFNEEPQNIEVTLLSPTDKTSLSKNWTIFIADYTAPRFSLKNATYHIWYINRTLFNQTTYAINSSNVTKQYFDSFTLNSYIWNVRACGENATGTTCLWADNNYTFAVGAEINFLTYNNHTYETSRETFSASLSILEDTEISLAQLVYNGTNYTISDIETSETTYNISVTIDVPTTTYAFTNDTKDFFFRFTYGGDLTQETETYHQNISYMRFQLCNATYPTTTLNFTYYDEVTSVELDASKNATSIKATFNYWLGGGNTYRNYSYNNLTNSKASQYKFCIYPTWQTFKTNMDLEYEAEAYSPRTYYLRNATLTNQTREIPLNLLKISDSVKFFIDVKQVMTPFTNAIVTISKYFTGEGVYKTISIRETDEVGEFIEYLDLDKKYRFSIVKDGTSYGTIIKQASCEEAPCEISLQVEEAIIDVWQGYYDIFATNVAYTLFYNDTNKLVTYTFNDLTGLAQYFRLLVTQVSYNQTGATICDVSLYSTAGTLTCDLSSYEGGDFVATGYIHRSPGKIVDKILIALSYIKDILGATGILISLFLIVTIALVGAWNPAVGVILVAFSVFMMKILGFVAFGYTTVILIVIMAIILATKMKT